MSEITKEAVQALIEKWAPAAQHEEETVLSVPVHVLLGEALDLATVIEHYWQPQSTQGVEIPGLVTAAGPGRISEQTALEIRELHAAVAAQHSRYLILVEGTNQAPLARAEFVLGELRAALTYAIEGEEGGTGSAQLERLREAFADALSHDALALSLEAYAELGDAHVKELGELGFDLAMLTEARTLAATLRARSAERLTNANSNTQREALGLRNRLATLLIDRMRLARSAARYVFRHHPDIARKATSAYERKRRARHRGALEASADQTQAPAASRLGGPFGQALDETLVPAQSSVSVAKADAQPPAAPTAARSGGPFVR